MDFLDKNFLVTGGAGFIGSNIVKTLLEKGAKVRILDNFATGKRENIAPFLKNKNFELIEGDLRDFSTVKKAVEGINYVLHQGALPSVPRSIEDPITTNNVNILGTLNILEAAKGMKVKRVVYASSSSVYGDSKVLPKKEDMSPNPLSPYALSKYAGERDCQLYYQIYGLETVCLRYFNVFGPNQDPTSQYSAAIPKFIYSMKNDKTPIIYGDGSQSRDFTFVENVVEANLLACGTDDKLLGEIFNIACGKSYTILELVNFINKILGKEIKPELAEPRTGDIKHSLASIEKAKNTLGYQPKIDFEQGLRKLISIS